MCHAPRCVLSEITLPQYVYTKLYVNRNGMPQHVKHQDLSHARRLVHIMLQPKISLRYVPWTLCVAHLVIDTSHDFVSVPFMLRSLSLVCCIWSSNWRGNFSSECFHRNLCPVECLGHSVSNTKVFVKRCVFATVNYTLGSPAGEMTLSQCVPH